MIEMRVTDKHDKRWPERRLFQPMDSSQIKLLMHCTGGMISASRELLEAYKDVFELHGIKLIFEDCL